MPRQKNKELMPGTVIECQSGRYLAYYEHRTDIIANGDNEKEAKKNLKKLYKAVKEYEREEAERESKTINEKYQTKRFTEKLDC